MKTLCNILAVAIVLGSGVGPNTESLAAAAAPKDKKKAHEVFTLQDGVLIDPVEKAIFVTKTEGGIEAIDIATGNTLWQSKKEEGMRWPVAVYGRTLVVRARDNPLRIAALDLDAKGKMLWITEPILPDWVKGPEWLKNKPRVKRVFPEWVPEQERNKPSGLDRPELELALINMLKGTYRCEERIEKDEFVMRWQAKGSPLDAPVKEADGVAFVDLETGKFRSLPLEKNRKIDEKDPLPTVEWQGIVLSVAKRMQVGNWVKTLPASRSITEGRYLDAVDKKTNKLLWQRTLWEWGYKETRLVNGG